MANWCSPAPFGRSLAQVPDGDQLLVDDSVHLAVLTAAILMQKFPGSVKLTCPENQCHIMRRLENWKHEDLAATGYIYNLYHYICCVPHRVLQTKSSHGMEDKTSCSTMVSRIKSTWRMDEEESCPTNPSRYESSRGMEDERSIVNTNIMSVSS